MSKNKLLFFIGVFILSGCSSSSNNNRYKIKNDYSPSETPNIDLIENAYPRYEAYSRGGNKSYTVFGKRYHVLPTAKGYKAEGLASWYGVKFHGHKTSNGETYDMYSMSAAHKTLPIPSYVKVTNEANNKQVIVRVNDRGPFHQNRLIDLSYAAAYKLGMLHQGVAKVKVEVINF